MHIPHCTEGGQTLRPERVFCVTAPNATYDEWSPANAPELKSSAPASSALSAFRSLLHHSRLDERNFGSPSWNPLGELIRRGDRVLIKPNWVNDRNYSNQGMECLVTHESLIEAILTYVMKAGPERVTIADAPIQGCDFDKLISDRGIPGMLRQGQFDCTRIEVKDLRRAALSGGNAGTAAPTGRAAKDYVLFDLGDRSYLEPITNADGRFRVSMYDPSALRRTHSRLRHQYLVAREAMEADIVISVPKLKTHLKAGLTGALKNVVGIIGSKDCLPHYRKGGSLAGGDCYSGKSPIKAFAERLMDSANRTPRRRAKQMLQTCCTLALGLEKLRGGTTSIEGSWHGNDTVWRMCLDLQTILHYGRIDGEISDRPARTVLTVTDAIIAGEGNGPLAPTPVPLGLLTMGTSAAALEWVHALLMGFDPQKIPLVRNAFTGGDRALGAFSPHEIELQMNGAPITLDRMVAEHGRSFRPANGWTGHCELHTHQFRTIPC